MSATRCLQAYLVLSLVLLANGALAQTAYRSPRNAFGQPDLEGIWTNDTATPLNRPAQYGDRKILTEQEVADLEEQINLFSVLEPQALIGGINFASFVDPGATSTVMRVRGEPRSSLITSNQEGHIPPTRVAAPSTPSVPESEASDNPETRTRDERCIEPNPSRISPVMLPALYNNNYQIVQGRQSIAIRSEMIHDVRIVRLGASHRTDGVRPLMGDSIGWWEGETLVIETTNFRPDQARWGGDAQDLKVTERLTRTGQDTLFYQFSLESPSTWDEVWGGEYEFRPARGSIYEVACHEGNYSLEGILAGARQTDPLNTDAK